MLALALALASCREAAPTPEPTPAPDRPSAAGEATPKVAVAGCHALGTAPICLRAPTSPPRPLTLWVPGAFTEPHPDLRFDGEPVTDAAVVLDPDGMWITVPQTDPPREGALVLRVHGRAPFTLELATLSPSYAEARSQMLEVRAESVAAAQKVVADADVSPRERHLLDCTLARVTQRRDPSTIPTTLARLQATAERVDEITCVARYAAQAADYSTTVGLDFNASRDQIDAVRRHADLDLRAAVQADYADGVLSTRLGLLGEALASHERAARGAIGAGLERESAAALVERGLLLARLGRFDDAAALAAEAEASVDDDFVREIQFQAAWIDILRREHDPDLPAPTERLRELASFYAERGEPSKQAAAQLNLAVAAIQSGDADAAARELAAVDREHLDDRQQLYHELVGFRIALARGQTRGARERLDRAELLAEVTRDREFRLELLDARAELETREGDPERARAAYERGELLADALALQIPVEAGRSSFAATLTTSRSRHLELTMAAGDADAGLCLVLGARARHLRSLAARRLDPRQPEQRARYAELLAEYHRAQAALDTRLASAWKLSERELAKLATEQDREQRRLDELLTRATRHLERDPPTWRCEQARPSAAAHALLTAYPTADGGWWVFLDRGGEVASVRAASPSAAAATEAALVELAADGHLDGVLDLTVVAIGPLLDVDLRALLPLASRDVRVRHGLGLGLEDRAREPTRVAAVLGSGGDGLVEIEGELEVVTQTLVEAGWRTQPWDPRADDQPTLLHYAGHAVHSGWTSHLALDDGRRLTSEQLIVGQRAPKLVVLGACDAGSSVATIEDGGMNVAVAFLLAGARLVIAPRGSVDDALARAFAEALYARLPDAAQPGAATSVDAWVDALAEVQRGDPRFAAWRAWVR